LISSPIDYKKAREELDYLARWLSLLESEDAAVRKNLTLASVRKMISRLQDELADYEVASASNPQTTEEQTERDDRGTEEGT
jgi:hypothetical protein